MSYYEREGACDVCRGSGSGWYGAEEVACSNCSGAGTTRLHRVSQFHAQAPEEREAQLISSLKSASGHTLRTAADVERLREVGLFRVMAQTSVVSAAVLEQTALKYVEGLEQA